MMEGAGGFPWGAEEVSCGAEASPAVARGNLYETYPIRNQVYVKAMKFACESGILRHFDARSKTLRRLTLPDAPFRALRLILRKNVNR
ncbi:hypothetical protein HCH_01932 [Hahella chejuensis KCTC 2396]|uniref:Uncharacterized protein n=1 Tax=Hahella chejuensis (strain KCTC 2396) TaxID=349521 RepID=Q2SKQ9_HAHCH|nr:hypothetical protein HCH_01932 [Hahella chejuensis KCTC 2396]